jgi:hypothetical protein
LLNIAAMRKTNTIERSPTIAPQTLTADTAQGIETYAIDEYDIAHIATDSLAQIIASAMGDRRLFESQLLIYRYTADVRAGIVGNQYFAWVANALEADIAYRREQLEAMGALVLGELVPVQVSVAA